MELPASVILSTKVRFRTEDGFIFLCDLRTLRDFELPLEHLTALQRLERGCEAEELSASELALARDLAALDLLNEGAPSPTIWQRLEFE